MGAQVQKKKPNKCKTILKALYIIIMAFYAIYGLVQAIKAHSEFKNLSIGFNNIVENWQEDIITNVIFSPSNAPCPVGFTDELSYNYGGSGRGCDCKLVTHNLLKKQIYESPSTCNSTMTQAGCIQHEAWPSQTISGMSAPGDLGNSMSLCIERKVGMNFITTATNMGTDGQCKAGFIACGSSPAADPDRENAMCVPASLGGCPVMDITAGGVPGPDSTSISNGGSLNFVISKEATTVKQPISELIASINNVCLTNNNIPRGASNANGYELRRGAGYQFNCSPDSDFISFHALSYRDVLMSNNVFPPVPQYQKLADSYSATDEMNYFKRPYIGLKKSCR